MCTHALANTVLKLTGIGVVAETSDDIRASTSAKSVVLCSLNVPEPMMYVSFADRIL